LEIQSIAPLDIGDPIPAIPLPSQAGAKVSAFQPPIAGNLVVLFASRAPDAAALEELAGFARLQDRFATLGVKLLAVTGASVAEHADIAAAHGIRFPVLSDGPGRVLDLLGLPQSAAPSADGPTSCSFVVDCSLRIVGRVGPQPGLPQAEAALAACAPLAAALAEPAPVISRQAPVLLVPDVLSPALCQQLIELWAQGDKQENVATGSYASDPAAAGNPASRLPSVKRRSDWLMPEGPLNIEIRDILRRRVVPELRKAFDFQPERYETLRVGCYDAERGGYFRRHRDNVGPPEIQRRRFAMSLNLNEEYEGGEIRFPEYGTMLYRPPARAALLFSCSLLHEAMEIRGGRRFVLLTFFFGPTPSGPSPSA
jgi:peroxiredoxin